MRAWACLSSSSGQTFEALWAGLSPSAQKSCALFVVDRDCGARAVAQRLVGDTKVLTFDRKSLGKSTAESATLKSLKAALGSEGMVLLCGFFGILSAEFLDALGLPVVNTHPTLLPSFQGLDQKVHARASEHVLVSGFTVHLATETLDGGPILFQHPVYLDPQSDPAQHRESVRLAEQKYLPQVFEDLLKTDLQYADRTRSGRDLRQRLALQGLRSKSFSPKELTA